MVLTSSQDFPCARRGYTGAFGFAKVMLFECAISFGCYIIYIQKMQIAMLEQTVFNSHGTAKKMRRLK